MFALGISYHEGVEIHAVLFGVIWLLLLLHFLWVASYNFVHEVDLYDDGYKKYGFHCDNGEVAVWFFLCAGLAALIATAIWPAVWPIAIMTASLLGARKFVRFQKKVDKLAKEK